MLKKIAPFCLIWLLFAVQAADERPIFNEKARLLKPEKSFSENLVTIGRSFIGAPYVPYTLENNAEEKLVTNLRQLDCLTFVENTVAICLPKSAFLNDFDGFLVNLTSLRYRDGIIDGYGSRLHYFSEWLIQQQNAGRLRLISEDLGGEPYQKKVGFMSRKRLFYPGLADSVAFEKVKMAESRLREQSFFFIPKNKIRPIEDQIQDGDLLVFTASKPDLDVTHEGFAIRQNGRIHLLHASSEFGRVLISRWPVADYLPRNKGQSGLMVARFY